MGDAGDNWYVRYTVVTVDENIELQAGPYSFDEVPDHLRDIRSYAGITNCYVTNEPLWV